MGALVGFVVGYVLGARHGSEGYAKIRQAVDTMLGSPEFKALVERGLALSDLLGNRGARAGSNGLGDEARDLLERDGQLRATWKAIADSEAIQSVVATGLSVANDLFERGMALLEERRGRSGARDVT